MTRIANVTGLDRIGVPVVAAYRPNARSVAVSQGKGLDLNAAKASAVMEAIESFHAEHPTLPLRLASCEELRAQARVADVQRLPRLSVSVYHPGKRMLWCEAHDLVSDAPLWVPYEMVHTDFTLPLPSGSGCFVMSSNGLASGNHHLEAISHAICELVERDAVALWNQVGGTARTGGRIDLDSIDDPGCREILNRMLAADLAVGVWDVSSDLQLPTFVCVIADRGPNYIGQFYANHGSGTHPTREVALLRALSEAAQTRLTYIAGARDDANREFFERARNPDRVATVRDHIDAADAASLGPFRAVPSRAHATFEEDLHWELECLAGAGIHQVAVVDLTREALGLPVVRAIIPGLESLHDAPGYVPGPRAERHMEREAQ